MANKEKQKGTIKDLIRTGGGYQPESLIGDHEQITPPSTGSNVRVPKKVNPADYINTCAVCGLKYVDSELKMFPICPKCAEERGTVPPSPSDRQANALADWMKTEADSVRNHNVGESDYSKHKIQPWDIWIEYKLNPFDADIIKRVLRHKKTDSRKMDYEKIIHICQERIRQIDNGEDVWEDK